LLRDDVGEGPRVLEDLGATFDLVSVPPIGLLGDWPISTLSGGYDVVWDGLSVLFDELDDVDRRRILAETTVDFYQLRPDLLVEQ
jgi:hypothetical protein